MSGVGRPPRTPPPTSEEQAGGRGAVGFSQEGVRTTGASVARGGLWNAAARAIPIVYVVVLSISAARFLGPQDFGRQSFIAFAEYGAIMLLSAGVPTAVIRFVGESVGRRDPAAARGLLRWAWRVEIVAALLAGAALTAVALAGHEPQLAWLFAAAAASLAILGSVPAAFLNGLQRWRETSLTRLVVNGVGVGATVAVLALGWGISGMLGVEALAVAVILVALTIIGGRRAAGLGPAVSFPAVLRNRVWRYAAIASLDVVATFVIMRRSEFFVLEWYSSSTQIGFYSIAFAAANAPVVVFLALTQAVMPAVSTLIGAGEARRIRPGFGRAIRLVLLLALPTAAAGMAFAPELVTLAYGSSFYGARGSVLIALCFVPIAPIIGLSTALLEGIGRLWLIVGAGIFGSVVDIGFAFMLIPAYGAVGAAIANGAGQLAFGVPVVAYAWRTLGGVDWQPATVARLACCSLMGGLAAWGMVVLGGGLLGVLAGVVVGGFVFSTASWLLRIISHEDALWLDATAGAMLGGTLGRAIRLWAASPQGEGAP